MLSRTLDPITVSYFPSAVENPPRLFLFLGHYRRFDVTVFRLSVAKDCSKSIGRNRRICKPLDILFARRPNQRWRKSKPITRARWSTNSQLNPTLIFCIHCLLKGAICNSPSSLVMDEHDRGNAEDRQRRRPRFRRGRCWRRWGRRGWRSRWSRWMAVELVNMWDIN